MNSFRPVSHPVTIGTYVLFSPNSSKPPFIGRITAHGQTTKGDTQPVTVAFERVETHTTLVTKTTTLPTSLLAHVPAPTQAIPPPFLNGDLVSFHSSLSELPITGKVEGNPREMGNGTHTVTVVFEAPQTTSTIITTTATLPLSALCAPPNLAASILALEPFPYDRFFNTEDISLALSGNTAQSE